MEEDNKETSVPAGPDIRTLIREAIREYVQVEQSKAEPAYKTELVEERKRREQMERRLNDLVEENKRTRKAAEETERSSQIRAELQRLGVGKIDLAFKVVKEEIQRSEDGRLIARTDSGEVPMREYLVQFVNENPELLPARMAGGSGSSPSHRGVPQASSIDLEKIRPGMSAEDLERARREIARIASQTLNGIKD